MHCVVVFCGSPAGPVNFC